MYLDHRTGTHLYAERLADGSWAVLSAVRGCPPILWVASAETQQEALGTVADRIAHAARGGEHDHAR